MLIMVKTNDLAMGVARGMVLHSIQALHAVCQMGGVRTVALREPQSFFTFEESEGTTGADVDVCGDARGWFSSVPDSVAALRSGVSPQTLVKIVRRVRCIGVLTTL